MANNYFGFPTHGSTQYSAQATNYPAAAAQGTYVHQSTHTAAYPSATPRAQTGYDTYQATHATPGQYAYTARQPTVATVKPAAIPQVATAPAASYQDSSTYYARTTHTTTPTYDSSKTYYQQPATQTPSYSATSTDAHYQTSAGKYTASTKPAYSTNTGYSATPQRTATTQKVVPASSSSYVYQSPNTQASSSYSSANTYVTTTASSYSGYDAALYNAATSYYQQQQSGTSAAKPSTGTWNKNKATGAAKPKPKAAPQTMQLHYCDVCKISCAGPQTYREHLEGSKHKKKEAAAQPRGGQNQLWCELCNVTCTGSDAYVAHLKGAKHMKVVKLHTLLGKDIPSSEPVLISTTGSGTSTTTTKTSGSSVTAATKTTPAAKPASSATTATATTKKVLATPKITFVGGSQLKTTTTTGNKPEEAKAEPMQAKESEEEKEERRTVSLASLQENETQPVGHEYIEEVKNDAGKIISFQCKLCECKFNDPNAKEMHLKGRRHRLQYKKKVDPYLQVEVKPSIRLRKAQEEKLRRIAQKEEYWKRKDMEEHRLREEMRELEAMQWQGGRPPMGPQGFPRPMMPMRRPDSSDDRHVMAKHASIYPTDAELQAVQNIVSSCEKALKLVSDHIADIDAPKKMDTESKVKAEEKKEEKESDKKDDSQSPRALKGVMRVGVLAKGLLLHGDLHVHLVVLCAEKPTRTLLVRVKDNLPKQLATVTEDKYDVQLKVEDAAIIVTSDKEPKTSCTITLTSPIMRDDNVAGEGDKVKDPPDVLDRQKCLNALAALRHAKWFQARANGLQSCVVVIRILRDLCQRVPTWAPLNEWAMELLVEKCVASGGNNMSPGDALRRVFECMASGILLPGGPGLYDPCEKESTDAAASLSGQEREDITASAQHALRLMAFRQIHKVLGMDPLPAPKFQRNRFNSRKRRRTTSTGDGGDSEAGDGKKDKKDEDAMETAEGN